MTTTTDVKTRTYVNLLRRRAHRAGYRLIKVRAEGFVLVDIKDPDKAVLGGERATGASATDVAKFLKIAA